MNGKDNSLAMTCFLMQIKDQIIREPKKITLSGLKQVYSMLDYHGNFFGADIIAVHGESNPESMYHPFEIDKHLDLKKLRKEPLHHKVMEM